MEGQVVAAVSAMLLVGLYVSLVGGVLGALQYVCVKVKP